MEYEIELKLLTIEDADEVIETKLLPHLKANIVTESFDLANHYFDTPDRILRQHDIGLRIRGNNHKFEQTLKTAGKSIGGLHQRPEYNVDLEESKKHIVKHPDLGLFPLSSWPKTINVGDVQGRIETLFTTHFQRKVYLLEFLNGDTIELVWDLGEVTSGNKSIPICEIELELKKGDTKVLFDLAERIVGLMPTTIGTHSKAARGYSLLDDLPIKQYQSMKVEKAATSGEEFSLLLASLLQDFQLLSIQIRHQHSEDLATNINNVLVELIDVLSKFSQLFPSPCLDRIHVKLEHLHRDWSWIVQQNNKNDTHRLLTHADTTQLQLDIVQCLVEQPWYSEV
jgi:triphosphatase